MMSSSMRARSSRALRQPIVAEATPEDNSLTVEKRWNAIVKLLTSYAVRRSGIAGLTLTLHYLSFEAMRELAQGPAAVIDDIDRFNSTQQAAYEKWQSGRGGAVKLWAAANL